MPRAASAAGGPLTFNIKVDARSNKRSAAAAAEALPDPDSLIRTSSLPSTFDDAKCGSPTMAGADLILMGHAHLQCCGVS
jgi:hypothetical protein